MDELTVLTWRIPRVDASLLERATLPEAGRAEALAALREATGAQELVYFPTCQRVTLAVLHAAPDAAAKARDAYARRLGRELPEPERFQGREAFHHLSEVASSLDSLVVGEPQVLGQMKEALARNEEIGASGPGMRHVFGLVLRAAKAVRAETELFRGKVSLVPLTEEALERHLAGNAAPFAAVLGTGQIGRRMAAMIRERRPDAQILYVSRDPERARTVAAEDGGDGTSLSAFLARPPENLDVLALAMATESPILDGERLAALAGARPLLVLDLALPRNAQAPATPVDGLTLVQLDDLARESAARKAERAREVEPARRVLERELARIDDLYATRHLAADIARLTRRFDEVAAERWAEAPANVAGDDAAARKWLEQTVRALLHEATAALKKADGRRP